MAEERKDTDDPSGFKVTDKRHFTSEGDVVPENGESPAEAEPSTGTAPEAAAPEPEKTAPETPAAEEPAPGPAPGGEGEKVDFTHLVMSLAGTAFHSLGMPDPVTKQKGTVNLPAASQMIDLLVVLEGKTKGNLSSQEDQILKGILTELKGLYVQASGFAR
jgi:hypothetical protein